ncbi:MAG TPA: CPBP family glutamic-type intramembrane protease [Symbiobacteriaceae bacterium]|jgi:membrane protease YdiL (CAAX protease family)|nr:CPBP family glutamic-type intramembrane protease [Symbiobacteriaceae bacterium]
MQNVAPRTTTDIDSSRSGWPLFTLVLRFGLFLAWQASFAGYFALQGEPNPWQASVAWWPVTVTLTNIICFVLLRWLARRDGITFGQLVHADFGREHLRKDLLLLLGVLLLAGPVAMIPNYGLGTLLFGDYMIPVNMFTQPLPVAVALITTITFPLTQSIGELPTYFGYAMPRLAQRWGSPWKAILVSAFWLGIQHMALPFIPQWRFALWRAAMFIPFALLLAWSIHRRPRLMPYLMVVHALIDLPVGMMVYQVSVGG